MSRADPALVRHGRPLFRTRTQPGSECSPRSLGSKGGPAGVDMSSCRLLRRSRIPGRTVAVSTRVWGGFAWRFQYGQAGLPATSFSGHAVLYGTGTQACAYLEARGQRFSICWLPLQKPELGLAEAGAGARPRPPPVRQGHRSQVLALPPGCTWQGAELGLRPRHCRAGRRRPSRSTAPTPAPERKCLLLADSAHFTC